MAVIIDTSAWIEFFRGTEKAKEVEKILKTEEIFTSIISFAEIVNWCFKNNIEDKIKEYISGIKKSSIILNLNEEILLTAGKLNYKRKRYIKNWGMIDSIIVTSSFMYGLNILTKDSFFRDLSNVKII